MTSRDIGPALPPHMRRSHGNADEDIGSNKEERNRDSDDERRRKHKDRCSDRDRQRDKNRGRTRRDEYRDYDRSTRHADRDRGKHREKREEDDRVNIRSGRPESSRKGTREHVSLSKRSKRSKTDRTYNTDTEESSDDSSYDTKKWTKVNYSDSSDSERDVRKMDAGAHLKPSSCTSSSQENDKVCSESRLESESSIGPALPAHLLPKDSSRMETLKGDSDINPSASTSELLESSTSDVDIGPALPPHLKLKVQSENEDSISETVGPALPSYLKRNLETEEMEHDDDDDDGSDDNFGPALPISLRAKVEAEKNKNDGNPIGPALPPHVRSKAQLDENESEDAASAIGPALPPNLSKAHSNHIGPALPPHSARERNTTNHSDDESSVIGPALPPGLRGPSALEQSLPSEHDMDHHSSDDEVVGPLLPEEMVRSGKNYVIQAELERNAAAIRRKLEEKDLPDTGVPIREEWMLELPPEGTVDLGLGARTFRARGAPEKGADRSSWTDTPADKVRKEEEAKRRFELGNTSTDEVKKAAQSIELSSRDKSMEVVVKKHKRSKESLLDSHQKKLEKEKKKKKKEAGGKQERRPFNREMDLKTNVFDDAQKKAIYKKAQVLDTRFSRGESKYL